MSWNWTGAGNSGYGADEVNRIEFAEECAKAGYSNALIAKIADSKIKEKFPQA